MAFELTDVTVLFMGQDPKNNPIRHFLLEIPGDDSYPGGNGSTGALAQIKLFLKEVTRFKPGAKQDSPVNGGAWIDALTADDIYWAPERRNPSLQQVMFYDVANDTLALRATTGDAQIAGSNLSANRYNVLIHVR